MRGWAFIAALTFGLGSQADESWLESCRAKVGPPTEFERAQQAKGDSRILKCTAPAPTDLKVRLNVRARVGPVWSREHIAPFEIQVVGAKESTAYSCVVREPQGLPSFTGYVRDETFTPMELRFSRSVLEAIEQGSKHPHVDLECEARWTEIVDKPGEHIFLTRTVSTRARLPYPQHLRLPRTRIEAMTWDDAAHQLEVVLSKDAPQGGYPGTRHRVECAFWGVAPKAYHPYFGDSFPDGATWESFGEDVRHRFTFKRGLRVPWPQKKAVCTVTDTGGLEVALRHEATFETPDDVGSPALRSVTVTTVSPVGRRTRGAGGCVGCDYGWASTRAVRDFTVGVALQGVTTKSLVNVTCESALGRFTGARETVDEIPDGGTTVVQMEVQGAVDPSMDGADILNPFNKKKSVEPDAKPTQVRCVARALPGFVASEPVDATVKWSSWKD